MNWTIVTRKFLEGAVTGGLASAAAMTAVPGDDNYWAALGAAFLTSAGSATGVIAGVAL